MKNMCTMLCCNTPTLSGSSTPRNTKFSIYYSIMSSTLKFTLFTIFELTILLLHLKKLQGELFLALLCQRAEGSCVAMAQ